MSRFRAVRRVGWGLGDQVLSSLTNVALTISVARVVSPTSFGVFATLVVTSQFVLVLNRALITDPLMVRHSASEDTEGLRDGVRRALGGAVGVGLLAGIVLAGIALALPNEARHAGLVFAAATPGIVLQDAMRFSVFTTGHPRTAFVNDLLWAVLQVGGIYLLATQGVVWTAAFVAVWGGAGTLCAAVGLAQVRLLPDVLAGPGWLRQNWTVSRYYVAENALLNGTNLVNIALIGLVAGFAASAGLRGAVTLFGPMAVLSLGARAALTPEFVRLGARDRQQLHRASLLTSGAFAMAGAAWGAVLLLMPLSVGREILGATWQLTEPLLVFIVIDSTVSLFTVGAFIGIRATGDAQSGLRARASMVLPRLALGVGGAAAYGALGAAVAFACLAPASIAIWLCYLRRAVRRSGLGGQGAAAPQTS